MAMQEISYMGFNIKIESYDCGESPRDWDNLGSMVCFHRRYNLGDKHSFSSPADFRAFLQKAKAVVLPLYLYDHSGLTMNTTGFSSPWDSGQVGWIYVEYDKIREEYGWKKLTKARIANIENYLRAEIEIYDQFLRGDIYGYVIEELDKSCWGYYGHDFEANGLLETARDVIDGEIEKRRKAKIAKVKAWAKNKVPLYARMF